MSHSTHQALGGMESAESRAHAQCLEAIERYQRVQNGGELAAVLRWSEGYDWFFRSEADNELMLAAYRDAKRRVGACEFNHLSRPAREKAISATIVMRNKLPRIVENTRMMLFGNLPEQDFPRRDIALWIDPTRRHNSASFILQAMLKYTDDLDGAATRAAFAALAPEEQAVLTASILAAVEESREDFYEGFPEFRPPVA